MVRSHDSHVLVKMSKFGYGMAWHGMAWHGSTHCTPYIHHTSYTVTTSAFLTKNSNSSDFACSICSFGLASDPVATSQTMATLLQNVPQGTALVAASSAGLLFLALRGAMSKSSKLTQSSAAKNAPVNSANKTANKTANVNAKSMSTTTTNTKQKSTHIKMSSKKGLSTVSSNEEAAISKIPSILSGYAIGMGFGAGLGVSGMTDPLKVTSFLDPIVGAWDPSLAFVMGGAVLLNLAAFRSILKRPSPVCMPKFELPNKQKISKRLLLGSSLFGLVWLFGCSGCSWLELCAQPIFNEDFGLLLLFNVLCCLVWLVWFGLFSFVARTMRIYGT